MIHSNDQNTDKINKRGKNSFMIKAVFLGLLAIPLLFVACDDSVTNSDPEPEPETVWEDGLNNNASNWITDNTSGPEGWCGDITHQEADGGPVSPSSGSGYAQAMHGECNDYWKEQDFPSSGPYAFYGELEKEWPSDGFIQDLDIYLDPDWSAGPNGTVFTYANSFRLLDGEYPNNLKYLFIPVTKQDGNLLVAGNTISDEGWYTFRFIFSGQDGNLSVKFELLKVIKGERTVFSKDIKTTSQSEEDISSFEATNIGNGYAWFVAIKPGMGLPIDEQQKLYQNS